jgi:hypothetical protein
LPFRRQSLSFALDGLSTKGTMQPENHSTIYTLSTAKLRPDGVVTVKVGGVSGAEMWDGIQEFVPAHPDHGFWKWIVERQFRAVVDASGLQEIRTRFESQVLP